MGSNHQLYLPLYHPAIAKKLHIGNSIENLISESITKIVRAFLLSTLTFFILYSSDIILVWLFSDHYSLLFSTLSLFTPRRMLAACTYFHFCCILSEAVLFKLSFFFQTKFTGPTFHCIFFNTTGFITLLIINYISFPFTGNALFHWGALPSHQTYICFHSFLYLVWSLHGAFAKRKKSIQVHSLIPIYLHGFLLPQMQCI